MKEEEGKPQVTDFYFHAGSQTQTSLTDAKH